MSSVSSKLSHASNGALQRQIPHSRIDDEDIIFKKYELMELLGKGSFGTVYKVKNKETNQMYAIKIINKERSNGKALSNFENEVVIMKSVSHPNLIRLEEVYETKKKLYLITELCEAGELSKWLKSKGPIEEDKSKIIMRKILEAIRYLHHNNIVHRDLKLENILIKSYEDDVENLEIKITDFGLSSQRETVGTDGMFEEYCGTPLYMAPEIIDNYPYSQLCDVWALGIIMYIMYVSSLSYLFEVKLLVKKFTQQIRLTNQNPFHADTEQKLREQIRKAEINRSSTNYMKLSREAKECLDRMFKVDPAYRLTSSELFSQPWFLDKKCSEMLEPQKNVLELMKEMLIEQDQQDQASKSTTPTCAISTTSNYVNSNSSVSRTNLSHDTKNKKIIEPNRHQNKQSNNVHNNGIQPQVNHHINHNFNNGYHSPRHALPNLTNIQNKLVNNVNTKYQYSILSYKQSNLFNSKYDDSSINLPYINKTNKFQTKIRHSKSQCVTITPEHKLLTSPRKTCLPNHNSNLKNNSIRNTTSCLDFIKIKSLQKNDK